jgi:uncharacterized protein (DUF2237 family)
MNRVKNVLGSELKDCSQNPLTGFYPDGCCNTGAHDVGMHTVCVRVTAEFLRFSELQGNDLTTPIPMFNFPGLKPGDQWCLCVSRWEELQHTGRSENFPGRFKKTRPAGGKVTFSEK